MSDVINIVDGSGDEVLQELNAAFKAVATDFIGGTAPSTTYAGQKWLDTSAANAVLKQRNQNNTDWVILGQFVEDEFQPANAVLQSDETVTKQGNNFNGASQLVMLDNQGRIPMLNGSLLTNLTLPTSQAKSRYIEVGSDHSSFKILAGTSIEVNTSTGTRLFKVTADLEQNFSNILDVGSSIPGKDYAIFLVPDEQGEMTLKTTLNASAPEGYAVSDVAKIGGLHTMCISIPDALAPNETVKGYNAGELVPNSLWDNLHRPKCSPCGMGYVDTIDLWGDFYNQSNINGLLTSVFGGTRVCNRVWDDHAEDMRRCGKRFLHDFEFTEMAEGSPQCVAVMGAAQPNPDTTGGHQATNKLYMVSKYFMWEMAGLQWQWLYEVCANGGSGWGGMNGASNTKGQTYGNSYALLAGGAWNASSYCGSRSRHGDIGRGAVAPAIGGRGACEPLNPKIIVA